MIWWERGKSAVSITRRQRYVEKAYFLRQAAPVGSDAASARERRF
jgi:hypothetical protein